MLMIIVLLAVSSGLVGFMVNRLYVMAVNKAINVKGQHYGRFTSPVQFWYFVAFACVALLFGLVLFGGCLALLLMSLWPSNG